jgi:hypothetical protein
MKVLCPVCNTLGILEERGNSKRILHYKGFLNNKRIYEKHTLGINDSEIGNKSMGINNPVLHSIHQSNSGVRSSVRLEHRTFNPGVAGSIPVGPAFSAKNLRYRLL